MRYRQKYKSKISGLERERVTPHLDQLDPLCPYDVLSDTGQFIASKPPLSQEVSKQSQTTKKVLYGGKIENKNPHQRTGKRHLTNLPIQPAKKIDSHNKKVYKPISILLPHSCNHCKIPLKEKVRKFSDADIKKLMNKAKHNPTAYMYDRLFICTKCKRHYNFEENIVIIKRFLQTNLNA